MRDRMSRAQAGASAEVLGRQLKTAAVRLPDEGLGFREGFLVADPDGHVMRVQEEVR